MATLLSWNVNGLRAVCRKGFLDWFASERPDMLCLQETKARRDQLSEDVTDVKGYSFFISEPERKGYSGVGLYTRREPDELVFGLGVKKFDVEGRVIRARYGDVLLYNVYFPNGGRGNSRVPYKMEFYGLFLKKIIADVKDGLSVIVTGDVNTAHREVDLVRPRENVGNTGFLPEERRWIDELLDSGFTDTFRMFEEGPGHYSWWDYKTRARERDVGWRLDYFFVSEDLVPSVKDAYILKDVLGSDHCPVGLDISL